VVFRSGLGTRQICVWAGLLLLPALGHADIFNLQYQQLDYPGQQNTLAYGINDSGTIAGYYWDPVLTSGGDRGFTYSNGNFQTYQVANFYSTDLYGINNAGDLAGSYNNQNFSVVQGFVIPAGGSMQSVGPPGATQWENYGINNVGNVVGSSFTGNTAGGYVSTNSGFVAIDCSNASAFPHGINDSGAIVGFCKDSNGIYTGFATSITCPTCLTSIGPAGAYSNFGYGVNNAGLIVGVTEDPKGMFQGFLLDNGVYQLLDFPGAVNTYVAGINNQDQIVGWFDGTDGNTHAFVASPVPEPATWTLMGVILILLSRRFWSLGRRVS
jgi:probable HAF family extracellular repeat protein